MHTPNIQMLMLWSPCWPTAPGATSTWAQGQVAHARASVHTGYSAQPPSATWLCCAVSMCSETEMLKIGSLAKGSFCTASKRNLDADSKLQQS